MTYTLTDIVRHIRFRTAATPALNTYEMDDQTPSRREVVSLSADIQYAVFELEKRLVLWMFVAVSSCSLAMALLVYGLQHL